LANGLTIRSRDMKSFCRKFWREETHDIEDCVQCKEAWDEMERIRMIEEKVGGFLYHRTNEERAALDHNGRP
jgi:hypothetical protein